MDEKEVVHVAPGEEVEVVADEQEAPEAPEAPLEGVPGEAAAPAEETNEETHDEASSSELPAA